jgi:hypothetical protein
LGLAFNHGATSCARNLIERFFNKIRQFRRVATRYDKLAAHYLAFINSHQIEFGCVLMCPAMVTVVTLSAMVVIAP